MDLTDYFNQEEFYFSESQGQMLRIEDMPFQQAFYSHRKLISVFGLRVYAGTNLYQAFIRKLCPTPAQIREQLERYGKACHAVYDPGMLEKTNGTRVRSKLYHAAKVSGKGVHTHKVDTTVGSYIEATVSLQMSLFVKGEQVA